MVGMSINDANSTIELLGNHYANQGWGKVNADSDQRSFDLAKHDAPSPSGPPTSRLRLSPSVEILLFSAPDSRC